MVKVTLELGQRRLGNRWGKRSSRRLGRSQCCLSIDGLERYWADLNTRGGDVGGDKNELRVTRESWQLE